MSEPLPPLEPGTTRPGLPIRLKDATRTYPGQPTPAVSGLTLEIPAGRTVALVGPSGCGKTTVLRMINRLIEPTEGQILIGDDDVLSMEPNALRRSIGYAIQQVGLIPHLTISANVSLVPRLLKWRRDRIAERVRQMLTVVGLDPEVFAGRYPRQLSGGQQQRVGVARALAADPPVLLMDEPFGAVDPITRCRLQDELIAIQHRLEKTIVFVTHDLDEAVKLGDHVLLLRDHGQIAQYDTPEAILGSPAGEFVRNFVGRGATLKRLGLVRLHDVPLDPARGYEEGLEISPAATMHDALDMLLAAGADQLSVVDHGRSYGSVSLELLRSLISRLPGEASETQD